MNYFTGPHIYVTFLYIYD